MTTFLLLHGIPGSSATWRPVADRLGGTYDVLTPDLLGFRGVPAPSGPDTLLAPAQARHVLGLLDEAGVERAVVVAHDFGGPVAAHLWELAPERFEALALFATNAFPDTPIPFPLSTLNVPLLGPVAERLLFSGPSLAMMVRQGTGRPRVTLPLDDYLGDRAQRRAIATVFAACLRRIDELFTPVEAALRTVTVPTLVGWGTRDPFFPEAVARRTAALVPGAELTFYDGAGHFLPAERPDEVARDVERLVTARLSS